MEFRPQSIPGCHVVALAPIGDERGFFARVFDVDEFTDAGLDPTISQMNMSFSREIGTTRGVHWQEEPFAEAKLVRCIRGRVFDVCVDLRKGSETWGHWVGVELTPENRLALYLPPGCGHAYQTLESGTEVLYSTSSPYAPDHERGARWDDPSLGIDWPLKDNLTVSEKDRSWPRVELR